MKTAIFLTLTKAGVVKMTKEKVKLLQGQRCVRLTLNVPDAVFADPPMLDAQLDVPAAKLVAPEPDAPVEVEIW